MSRFISIVRCAFVVALLAGVYVLPASALTSEEIVAKSKGSVVRILVEVKPEDKKLIDYYGLKDVRKTIRHKAGSGFIVNKDGYIVTSYLVLPPSEALRKQKVYVRLPKEGDQLAVEVTNDPDRQIACFRIKKSDLAPLSLTAEEPKVGNDVYAMGFPYAAVTSEITDQEPTFTEGKIGALKQTQQESTLVQTNAAINYGSTGGPLLNSDGQVVGVIIGTADKSLRNRNIKKSLEGMLADKDIPVGISFATPSKLLSDMLLAAGIDTPPAVATAPVVTPPGPAVNNDKIKPNDPNTEPGGDTKKTSKGDIWLWGVVAVMVLLFGVVGAASILRKPTPQEKSPDLPIPPQPSFSKSTTISLGTLLCTEGELAGKTFSMTEKGLTIGRDNECDIRLNSEVISRRHSWIGPKGGDIAVRDMGSTNGTFVNGKKVEGVLPLQKGDAISLSKSGQEIFQFAD